MDKQKKFLKALCEGMDASHKAYKNYMAGGKTFRDALELKKYNSNITSLLTEQKHLLANALQPDAGALLIHYNAWTKKWEQLAATLQPAPNDVFVFENDITFPRQSARRLEEEYRAISRT